LRLQKILCNEKDKRAALLGLMLGDGYIRRYNQNTKKGEFRFTHSLEQEGYLDFKKEILSVFPEISCNKTYRDTYLKKTDKTYKQVELTSNANKKAGFVYRKFYSSGVKKLSDSTINQLTDFSLYLWYLDDGYLNIRYNKDTKKVKEYRIFLYLECFALSETQKVQNWFIKKYNITPNINKKGKGFSLYFNSSKTRDFLKIIDKYYELVPCMQRKFLKFHNLL